MGQHVRTDMQQTDDADAPHWRRVLAAAETSIERMYAATFFARRHISIVDQQIRSLNLSRALSESGLITDASRVAIIGGSFSGMTCAVALSMRHNCIIHVFERDDELLKRFREGGFRYIHPNLNDRANDIFSSEPHKATDFPFLNWSGNYAPAVASEFCRKFEHYRRHTNIALHLGLPIQSVRADGGRPVLKLPLENELQADVCILATGYGAEGRSNLTSDISYWHSGNPESYEPPHRTLSRRKNRILISGNGDSAIIELAHYLIRDFAHKKLLAFLPSEDLMWAFGEHYSQGVRHLAHRQIEGGSSEFPDISGPISWYWHHRRRIAQDAAKDRNAKQSAAKQLVKKSAKTKSRAKPAKRAAHDKTTAMIESIFRAIDEHLGHLAIGADLPPVLVAEIESEIGDMVSDLASHEIADMVRGYKLSYIFSNAFQRGIAKRIRSNIPLTIIGKTPTIYSSRQSPLNWFLLVMLERYAKFKYIQGRLRSAKRKRGVTTAVIDGEGGRTKLVCDKLVVRHGPDYRSFPEQVINAKRPQSHYRPDYGALKAGSNRRRGERNRETDLLAFFRTKRWKQLALRACPLDDFGEDERSLGRRRIEHFSVDRNLLALCAWNEPETADAEALFRKFKASRSERVRQRLAGELDSLRFSGSLGFPMRKYAEQQAAQAKT